LISSNPSTRLEDKHHAVDLCASVARSKYKIQEESEPRARQEKERITSPKKKKRRRKRAINERYAPVPWKVLIREHDARGIEQTNIFRESACTYTCTRTLVNTCINRMYHATVGKKGCRLLQIRMEYKMTKKYIDRYYLLEKKIQIFSSLVFNYN